MEINQVFYYLNIIYCSNGAHALLNMVLRDVTKCKQMDVVDFCLLFYIFCVKMKKNSDLCLQYKY